MITKEEAIKLVYNFITKNGTVLQDNPPYIIEDKERQLSYGWLFFWGSKKYKETGDIQWGYIGNAPILVDKYDKTLKGVGLTTLSIKEQLDKYAREKGYS